VKPVWAAPVMGDVSDQVMLLFLLFLILLVRT